MSRKKFRKKKNRARKLEKLDAGLVSRIFSNSEGAQGGGAMEVVTKPELRGQIVRVPGVDSYNNKTPDQRGNLCSQSRAICLRGEGAQRKKKKKKKV